jgi:hypothetical protein
MVAIRVRTEVGAFIEITLDLGTTFKRNDDQVARLSAFSNAANLKLSMFARGFAITTPCQNANDLEVGCDYSVFEST